MTLPAKSQVEAYQESPQATPLRKEWTFSYRGHTVVIEGICPELFWGCWALWEVFWYALDITLNPKL